MTACRRSVPAPVDHEQRPYSLRACDQKFECLPLRANQKFECLPLLKIVGAP